MNPTAWVFLGSIGALITAIATAVALLRKLGPEVNQIQIDSAGRLTGMAESLAEQYRTDAQEARAAKKDLDDRITEQARQLGEATQRITQLEETAAEVVDLRAEVVSLRTERDSLLRQNHQLQSRVSALEAKLPAQRPWGDPM